MKTPSHTRAAPPLAVNPPPKHRELAGWDACSFISFPSQPGKLFLSIGNREPMPVSDDLAFLIGSFFGCFEPFDGGFEVDGSRLLFTRQSLLDAVFGDRAARYACASLENAPRDGAWHMRNLCDADDFERVATLYKKQGNSAMATRARTKAAKLQAALT